MGFNHTTFLFSLFELGADHRSMLASVYLSVGNILRLLIFLNFKMTTDSCFVLLFCQNGISVMLDRRYEKFDHPACKRFEEMMFNCTYCFYLTFTLNIYILQSFLNMLRFYSLKSA